ncbi:helix-turn-helix transcriptional regulator [Thalassomonas haliotis]|uniref:Helix-turn-helix transcriptional regulator n=1 Tax=Thalassomonas haliotis TaxID=485448 RepID=A0ABY7VE99_9GAMM|nr:helix-turn-helix transcriptional regulator [Thalassomonas haliotis]WDE11760.1 helix-turn-helix transcriptional regulator [Thalassomonas haliotis]
MFKLISGDDLKRMRLSCNRTTDEMAKKIGVTRQTYEKYEAGTSQIRLEDGLRLMVYCKIDISPILNHFIGLKKLFSQYKEFDDEQPNRYRASTKKDHLKPGPEELEDL